MRRGDLGDDDQAGLVGERVGLAREAAPRIPRLRERAPYTVVAYVAVVATILVVALINEGPHRRLVVGGLLLVGLSLALLRGLWLAWLSLTVISVSSLVAVLVRWPAWWTVFLVVLVHLAMLALLLARPTRRYAGRGRPRLRARFRRERPGPFDGTR